MKTIVPAIMLAVLGTPAMAQTYLPPPPPPNLGVVPPPPPPPPGPDTPKVRAAIDAASKCFEDEVEVGSRLRDAAMRAAWYKRLTSGSQDWVEAQKTISAWVQDREIQRKCMVDFRPDLLTVGATANDRQGLDGLAKRMITSWDYNSMLERILLLELVDPDAAEADKRLHGFIYPALPLQTWYFGYW